MIESYIVATCLTTYCYELNKNIKTAAELALPFAWREFLHAKSCKTAEKGIPPTCNFT